MRSFVAMSCLMVFTFACDAAEAEPGSDAPAATPAATTPAPSEGVRPAPTPPPVAPVIATPVVPAAPPQATPLDVCRHVREVGGKDQPAASVLDEVERDCVAALEGVRTRYDTLTSCLAKASTSADVGACEQGIGDWTGLLSKATPKPTSLDVCNHVIDLMKLELGDASVGLGDADMASIREECTKELDNEQGKLGAQAFDARVACVMASTKLDDLAKCEQSEDQPGANEPNTTPTTTPSALQICTHVMDVMKRELGDTPTFSDEDLNEFQDTCIDEIAKQRAKIGAEAFDAQAACIMKVETLAAMTTCEPKE